MFSLPANQNLRGPTFQVVDRTSITTHEESAGAELGNWNEKEWENKAIEIDHARVLSAGYKSSSERLVKVSSLALAWRCEDRLDMRLGEERLL